MGVDYSAKCLFGSVYEREEIESLESYDEKKYQGDLSHFIYDLVEDGSSIEFETIGSAWSGEESYIIGFVPKMHDQEKDGQELLDFIKKIGLKEKPINLVSEVYVY